ncbi:MAG: response regulator [Candidatus Lambdaproteobacteria bacterium]|nr:response regulator [Candidatus Lambdaproteobacteria bacterium]
MNDRQLAVLMVEDSEDDAFLVARELERGGYQPLIERVQSARALAAALPRRQWDVVLSDYSMPGFDGLAAFRMVYARHGLDIPFIFVSGAIGEARAVEAMKLGVADYVFKDNLGRLIPAIDRELREAAMRRERRQMIAALEASEANFRTVIRDASHGVVVTRGGSIRYCNQTLATMFGHESAAGLIGTRYADLIAPEHRPAHAVGMAGGETDEGFQRRGEFRGLRPDGATLWIEERAQHSVWFGQPAVISWGGRRYRAQARRGGAAYQRGALPRPGGELHPRHRHRPGLAARVLQPRLRAHVGLRAARGADRGGCFGLGCARGSPAAPRARRGPAARRGPTRARCVRGPQQERPEGLGQGAEPGGDLGRSARAAGGLCRCDAQPSARGAPAADAEAGGDRLAGGRRGARLQQRAVRDPELFGVPARFAAAGALRTGRRA